MTLWSRDYDESVISARLNEAASFTACITLSIRSNISVKTTPKHGRVHRAAYDAARKQCQTISECFLSNSVKVRVAASYLVVPPTLKLQGVQLLLSLPNQRRTYRAMLCLRCTDPY